MRSFLTWRDREAMGSAWLLSQLDTGTGEGKKAVLCFMIALHPIWPTQYSGHIGKFNIPLYSNALEARYLLEFLKKDLGQSHCGLWVSMGPSNFSVHSLLMVKRTKIIILQTRTLKRQNTFISEFVVRRKQFIIFFIKVWSTRTCKVGWNRWNTVTYIF